MASINDYQRSVANLRQCMKDTDSLMESEFQTVADAYNTAVSEVNTRLTRCAGLLQQSMRAQAILEANVEPNLIDAVQVLDIAELFQWTQLAKQYACAASKLDMESAKLLNQAYDAQVPLEPLLRIYRKLALQRAPLSERLTVLRKIADTDSHNLAWQEDLELFERARIEELREDIVPLIKSINKSVSTEDHQALELIFQELTGSNWTEQPPPQLLQKIKKARKKSTSNILYAELKELEIELNDAFNELDFARARDLRDRWDTTIASCPLTHDDPVLARAQSALGWIRDEEIREQNQFEIKEALQLIEDLLDAGGTLSDIDAQIARATKHDEPLPEYLESRIERYRERLHKIRTQKFIAVIVGLFLLVLATAAVGLYIAKTAGDANRTENQIAQIDKLAANENWESVLSAIEESGSEVNTDPRTKKNKLTAEKKLVAINQWREKNKKSLDIYEKKHEEISAALVEARDTATFRDIQPLIDVKTRAVQIKDEIEAAEETLKHSSDILKSDSDKSTRLAQEGELSSLDRKLTVIDTDAQEQINKLFNDQYRTLLGLFEPLQDKTTALTAKEISDLDDISAQLQQLEQTFANHADNKLTKLIRPITNQIKTTLTGITESKRFHKQINNLSSRMTNATGYRNALEDIVRIWPNDPRTPDIQDSIKDTKTWKLASEYTKLVKDHAEHASNEFVNSNGLEAWIQRASNFASENPEFPFNKKLAECVAFFTPIAMRKDAAEQMTELSDLLSEPLFDEMNLIRFDDATNYFIPPTRKPKGSSNITIIRHYTDTTFDNANTQRVRVPSTSFKIHKSPHYLLKDRLEEQLELVLNDTRRDAWELTFRRMLSDVLTDKYWKVNGQTIEANDVVRHQLAARILQAACNGSHSMQVAFKRTLEGLQNSGVDIWEANWATPDALAQFAEDKAQRDLDDFLNSAKRSAKTESNERKAGWNLKLKPIRPYGILLRDDKKNWVLKKADSNRSTPSGSGTLHAPILLSSTQDSFPQIGTLINGQHRLDTSKATYFQIGRPIFFIPEH